MDIEKREEYKTYTNQFTEDKLTPQHKEQATHLITSIQKVFVTDIAKSRRVGEDTVMSWLQQQAVFTASEAKENQVIDEIAYGDTTIKKTKDVLQWKEKEGHFLYLQNYLAKRKQNTPHYTKQPNAQIGIVFAKGGIMSGDKQDGNPLQDNEDVIYGDHIARAIRAARKDKSIKIIILRVDSPGGSALGSDAIAREIQLAETENSKRVIVSMGNVAGSGGYWIAMDANEIYLNKTTITGSIGVLFAKPNIRKLMENKLGVTEDKIVQSEKSLLFSAFESVDETNNRKLLQHLIDVSYEEFINRVAQGRKLDVEFVRSIAKGNVYTGEKALELKLVDGVADLSQVIEIAKERIGLTKDAKVQVKTFPAKQSAIARLLRSEDDAINKEERDKHLGTMASASVGIASLFVGREEWRAFAFVKKLVGFVQVIYGQTFGFHTNALGNGIALHQQGMGNIQLSMPSYHM